MTAHAAMSFMPSLARRAIGAVECLVSGHAEDCVRALAAARKLQPLHLALEVPGLCHTHNPSRRLHADCAYCLRAGNVFSGTMEASSAQGPHVPDIVRRYQVPILELLVDFADELLDAVHSSKGVDVEDVRTETLDALRLYIRGANKPEATQQQQQQPEGDKQQQPEDATILPSVTTMIPSSDDLPRL